MPKGLNKSVVKIECRKGLSNPSSTVFGRKGLTNSSKIGEAAKWGTSGDVSPSKNGVDFLTKGLNKSVVKIECQKGLSNPSSTVFGHKGLTNSFKIAEVQNEQVTKKIIKIRLTIFI